MLPAGTIRVYNRNTSRNHYPSQESVKVDIKINQVGVVSDIMHNYLYIYLSVTLLVGPL